MFDIILSHHGFDVGEYFFYISDGDTKERTHPSVHSTHATWSLSIIHEL